MVQKQYRHRVSISFFWVTLDTNERIRKGKDSRMCGLGRSGYQTVDQLHGDTWLWMDPGRRVWGKVLAIAPILFGTHDTSLVLEVNKIQHLAFAFPITSTCLLVTLCNCTHMCLYMVGNLEHFPLKMLIQGGFL